MALRYFNVFGPRQDPNSQYSAVIPRFITRLVAGHAPVIYGDGRQSRDFTFIENVVQANILAMSAPAAPGRVYNIAWGERTSLNELLGTLRGILGSSIEAEYLPGRPGDVQHSMANISRARRDLGYEPAVGLRNGLEQTAHSLHGLAA